MMIQLAVTPSNSFLPHGVLLHLGEVCRELGALGEKKICIDVSPQSDDTYWTRVWTKANYRVNRLSATGLVVEKGTSTRNNVTARDGVENDPED